MYVLKYIGRTLSAESGIQRTSLLICPSKHFLSVTSICSNDKIRFYKLILLYLPTDGKNDIEVSVPAFAKDLYRICTCLNLFRCSFRKEIINQICISYLFICKLRNQSLASV